MNITINIYDFGLDNGFLDTTPKVQETKEKTDKLDCIRILNFSNETNKNMKRQSIDLEKIFANPISDREIVCKYLIFMTQ